MPNIISSENRSKRVVANTLMLYFRMAFTMVVSLYISRIIINVLGVDDYGLYNVVAGFVTFFNFFIYTMQTATQRFLNTAMGKNDRKEMNDVYSASIVIHIVIFLLVLVVGETLGLFLVNHVLNIPPDRIVAVNWVYQLSLYSTLAAIISIPYNAEIIAHEKMQFFAYVSIFDALLKLLICFLISESPFDKLVSYSFLLMCVSFINSFLFVLYSKRNFEECVINSKLSRSIVKEMINFAGWDLLGVIASLSVTHGTTIMINLFFAPVVNAAKAISEQVRGAINSFANNFMMALNPQITQSYAAGDISYLNKILFAGSRISFALLYLISLPVCIKTQYILELWLEVVPDYSVIFIRIILVDMLINSLMTPLNIAALATGKIKEYGFLVSILTIMYLPVCYIMLTFGAPPYSVFVGLLLLSIIKIAIWLSKLRSLMNFSVANFISNVCLPCMFVVLLTMSINALLDNLFENSILHLCLFVFVNLLFTSSVSFCVLCSRYEKDIIISKLKNKFL